MLAALLGGYDVLVGGLWALQLGRSAAAAWFVAAHVAAALLLWRASVSRRSIDRGTRIAGLSLVLLPFFWLELGPLVKLLHRRTFDGVIVEVESRVLGGPIHDLLWRWAPALHSAMDALYFLYLPALLALLVWLAAQRSPAAFSEAMLRATVTYLCCDLVYLAFPVLGPLGSEPALHAGSAAGLPRDMFAALNDAMRGSVDSAGTAFPSSHAAGIVTAAVIARGSGRRWLAYGMAAIAVGVTVSTVYTQNHYLLDAVAGVLLAFSLQYAVVPALLGSRDARGGRGAVKTAAPGVAAPAERSRG